MNESYNEGFSEGVYWALQIVDQELQKFLIENKTNQTPEVVKFSQILNGISSKLYKKSNE